MAAMACIWYKYVLYALVYVFTGTQFIICSESKLITLVSLSPPLSLPLSLSLSLSPLPTARVPTFIVHPANITVSEGANFTLNCSAIGLPDPTVELLNEGYPVPAFIATKIADGSYEFTNADDNSVPGEYVCRADNTFGVIDSYTATIVVLCESLRYVNVCLRVSITNRKLLMFS